MKRTLSIVLVFSLMLSAFVLASCKGTNDKDAQNTAPPHSAVSETAAPTDTPAAAPETEAQRHGGFRLKSPDGRPKSETRSRNRRMACRGNAAPLLRRLYEP